METNIIAIEFGGVRYAKETDYSWALVSDFTELMQQAGLIKEGTTLHALTPEEEQLIDH